jgi:hypothetical protein
MALVVDRLAVTDVDELGQLDRTGPGAAPEPDVVVELVGEATSTCSSTAK